MSTLADPSASAILPADFAAGLDRRNVSRSRRYSLLEFVRSTTTRIAGESCMMSLGLGAQVHGTSGGTVHVSGVNRCGSPWACPVCAPTIGETRASEIDEAIHNWMAAGGTVQFLTVTLRHKCGDHLDQLLEMLQTAYSRTFRFRRRPAWYGGQIRAVEITHGLNGWHPHIHAAVFVKPGETADLDVLRHRWADSVARVGGSTDVTSAASPGWDLRPVEASGNAIGDYLTKIKGGWSTGHEIARPDIKSVGVTPFALLDLASMGDTRAANLWKVYELATAGRRRIVSSPGLMASMKSDEDAAVAEIVEPVTVSVYVPAKDWRRLLLTREAAQLLADVSDLATGRSVRWLWPPGWLLSLAPSSSLS